ncbi:hypothetical protein Lal_00024989 [Lupinus albus]|uniref:Uncharacterized protein n=1 Tax=Lupinus albus TaxID=3870 RepID=A0A6A5NXF7_LUPAL|nr:hypothetical protein Lalb_Chr10g0101461 [Lupinus albus]KAF1889661.1 hypothetical protein Lal_00024989 [Lupinus albus]
MGCCISIPDNHSLQNQLHSVEDKLVISQTSPTSKKLKHISPSSPTSSTTTSSSICSFTCTTNSNSTTSSSSFKDRSFSNEFLWSCYKENPHIIRINSLKEATHSFIPTKPKATTPSSPMSNFPPIRQSPPQKKRVRSNSPVNLTRQKSFRKEVADQRLGSSYNLASGMLRSSSPSPSRRFNGDNNSLSKRTSGSKTNVSHFSSSSSSLRKENIIKPISPNKSSRRLTHSGLRHSYKVNDSKIDETNMVKEVVSKNGVDSGLIEDIDNPLVSFDCFIFL